MKIHLLIAMLVAPLAVAAHDVGQDQDSGDPHQRLERAAEEIALMASDSMKQVFKTVHLGGHDENRAMLGINVSSVKIVRDNGETEQSTPTPDGVEIHAVSPGGPADVAGLESGDVVLALNGQQLAGQDLPPDRQLLALMDGVSPGDVVVVRYRRGDREDTAQVTTKAFSPAAFGSDMKLNFEFDGEGPHAMEEVFRHIPGLARLGRKGPWRGLELVPLTPKLGKYFDADSGLLVVRAPAHADMQLEEGDVILSIAGATPASPPEAMRLLSFYEPGEKVEIDIRRNKRNRSLRVTLPEPADSRD